MAAACDIQEEVPLNENELSNKIILLTNSSQDQKTDAESDNDIQDLQAVVKSEYSHVVPVVNAEITPVINAENTSVINSENAIFSSENAIINAESIQVIYSKSDSNSVPLIKVETAVQANDYEIESRSGKVPRRKRLIPFKFRDYRNPELVNENADKSDSDYDQDSDFRPAKRLQRSPKRRGRPRKYPVPTILHEITKHGGNIGQSGAQDLRYVIIQTVGSTENEGLPSEDMVVTEQNQEKCDDKVDKPQEVISTGSVVEQCPTSDNAQETLPESSESQDKACGNEHDQYVQLRVSGQKKKYNKGKLDYFACLTCDKVFTTRGNLKTHEKIHAGEKPFHCDVSDCSKSFRSFESLRRHRLAHMGIKPFECSVCQNKFSSNVCLQEHMSRHSDIKPHQCHICLRNFRQVSCLRRHLITHSTEMPFTCQVCGRKFSQSMYLKSHMKKHTGERPFKCKQCEKAFAHQSDLYRHKIVHTGEKPYECEVCHTKFSDPSSKRRHQREHVGTKSYVCQLCFESFKRAGQLKAHLNRKHVMEKDEVQILRTSKGGLHFVFNNGEKQDPKFSIGESINPNSQTKQKKIVKLIEDLNSSMVQHVQINLPPHDYSAPEGEAAKPEQASHEDLAAVETVVMETMHCDSTTQIINSEATSSGTQIQTLPVPEYNNVGNQEPTVITIAEVLENGQLQTVHSKENVPVEYLQIIEELAPDSLEEQIVEVHYQQPEEYAKERSSPTPPPPTTKTTATPTVNTDQPKSPKSQTVSQNASEESSSLDFVNNPDFSSQQYYNWLSSFTELCKMMPMPLDVSLFQKISQVHKTLSDVMATPSGVIADKENFKILMNISKELNTIINEHLFYVMQNLNGSETKQ